MDGRGVCRSGAGDRAERLRHLGTRDFGHRLSAGVWSARPFDTGGERGDVLRARVLPAASSALPFSLRLPAGRDPRAVEYSVSARVPATGTGQLVVTVTNLTDRLIGELVLRWPTSLAARLSLAPFSPSMQRIADGGPPLVQPWTKWVEGPGEGGEPAGTTSLGWGPLLPRSTLVVTLVATRGVAGPVAFDLQLLTGEAILTGADGNLARTRVQVP